MFSVTSLAETDVAAKECQECKNFLSFYRESKIHIFMSKKISISVDGKNWLLICLPYKLSFSQKDETNCIRLELW